MTEEKRSEEQYEPVNDDELEKQEGEPLPDREVMTILPIDPTAPAKFIPPPPSGS
jgi:hypothetical protein